MIDYDLHIHTEYCGHAAGMTVRAICRRADELGLRTIAVTDHIYGPEELAVIEKIRQQADLLHPQCRVLIGAEIDVDGNFDDGRLVMNDFTGMDYVIAGIHYVPTLGHFPHSPRDRGMDEEHFLDVWEKTLLGVVSNPEIHTLAHPGRLPASCINSERGLERMLETLEKAARRSAKNRIAWEVNEMTRYRVPPPLLDRWRRIYEIALQAGVRLVYGSDAHNPEEIGRSEFSLSILGKLPAGSLSTPQQILGEME